MSNLGLFVVAIAIMYLGSKIKEGSLVIANAILEKRVKKLEDKTK